MAGAARGAIRSLRPRQSSGVCQFARLAEGQHPLTGDQFVQRRQAYAYQNADGETIKSVGHRAAWDATFSAPTSTSLTTLVRGDERIREAHRQAVTTALTELERYTRDVHFRAV